MAVTSYRWAEAKSGLKNEEIYAQITTEKTYKHFNELILGNKYGKSEWRMESVLENHNRVHSRIPMGCNNSTIFTLVKLLSKYFRSKRNNEVQHEQIVIMRDNYY